MSLSIIGAGFGRTGTSSLKRALELLGFGPCHHMTEVNTIPEQKAMWRAIAAGGSADWDSVYESYQSAVDWPTAHYWRELAEHFPDAKVILTIRDADQWYESMAKTILPAIARSVDPDSLGVRLIGEAVFAGAADNRESVIAAYHQNVAAAQQELEPARLLTFNVGDGWAPLCDFLKVSTPNEAFPWANTSAEFNNQR